MFSLIFLSIRKPIGDRFVPVLAAVALPTFVLSSAEMAGVGIPDREAAPQAQMMRDFEVIRDVLGEGVSYIPLLRDVHSISPWRVRYYLAGSVILVPRQWRQRDRAGFLILGHRDEGPALLTPDNRRMFLYDRALYGRIV